MVITSLQERRLIHKGPQFFYINATWSWDCKMVQLPWNTAWQFLTALNIVLVYNPAIVLVGISPNELKTCVHKNMHTCL